MKQYRRIMLGKQSKHAEECFAGNFVGVVLEHFFGAIDGVVGFVAGLDFLALHLVFVGM